MRSAPSPFTASASERFSSPTMSSTERGCSTKTFERESSAACLHAYFLILDKYLKFYGQLSPRERTALHRVEVEDFIAFKRVQDNGREGDRT